MGEFVATLRERVLDARREVRLAWRLGDVDVHGWADGEIHASVIGGNG